VANVTIKAEQIIRMSRLLLQREIVLPQLVWRDFGKDDFVYAKNDTVTLSVPALMKARRRTLRSHTPLIFDEFRETSVDVKVDQHVYKGIRVTDENLTLDIKSFAEQVLQPEIRSVAEELEEVVAEALEAAAAASVFDTIPFDASDDPYDVLVDARKAMNDANLPMSDRIFVMGSTVEAAFLKNDHFKRADYIGDAQANNALRDAQIGGRVAGFTVVQSNALEPTQAFAYHKTAVAFAAFAPDVPMGASAGSKVQSQGLGMRYIRDYDPRDEDGPADRSLVDTFAGAKPVNDWVDPEDSASNEFNRRIVPIEFFENS